MSPDSVLHMLHRVLKRAGLPEVRFHDLRHTFATLALQNGVDIKTVSGMLGHFSAGFTLDTYAHVTTSAKREAAKTATSLTDLDAMITQLLNHKDTICRRMEVMSASRQQEAQKPTPAATAKPGTPAPKPPKIMTVRRYDLCSVKRLQSKEDIDKYVEAIREKLMKTLESCDGVQIN